MNRLPNNTFNSLFNFLNNSGLIRFAATSKDHHRLVMAYLKRSGRASDILLRKLSHQLMMNRMKRPRRNNRNNNRNNRRAAVH
jgi:hypothetical protein